MGQRANLIVVPEEGPYELYYSHWRANTLDSDLFWGPEVALDFIRRQRSVADGAEWLDERWCEGGAVMDLRRCHLLWFGGEDIQYDVNLRRVLFGVMAHFWPGWTFTWAAEGIADLARYAGEPVAPLLVNEASRKPGSNLANLFARAPARSVISVRDADGVRLHASPMRVQQVALAGEALRDAMGAASRGPLATDAEHPPDGGLHVDCALRRLTLWIGTHFEDAPRRVAEAWPGWDVDFVGDRFEEHVAALGGQLVWEALPDAALLENVRSIVLREPPDFSGLLARTTKTLFAAGKSVEVVNPFGSTDAPPDAVGSAEAFDRAVAAWRRSGGLEARRHE